MTPKCRLSLADLIWVVGRRDGAARPREEKVWLRTTVGTRSPRRVARLGKSLFSIQGSLGWLRAVGVLRTIEDLEKSMPAAAKHVLGVSTAHLLPEHEKPSQARLCWREHPPSRARPQTA